VQTVGKEGYLPVILRIVRRSVLIDLIILAVVGLVGSLLRWPTPYDYGTGLTWAGVAAIGAAFLSGAGAGNAVWVDLHAYARTGAGKMHQHMRRIFDGLDHRFVTLLPLGVAGTLSIVLGYLLQVIALSAR
jgi:hypothetical protein